MHKDELENLIYEYGHLQYKLGRMETDEKIGMKEYTKISDKKDQILKEISLYFKSVQKIQKQLNM